PTFFRSVGASGQRHPPAWPSIFLTLADFMTDHTADGGTAYGADHATVGCGRTRHTAHAGADSRAFLALGHAFPCATGADRTTEQQSHKQGIASHFASS